MIVRQPLRDRMRLEAIPYFATLLNCPNEEAWTRQVTFQVFDDTSAKDRKKAGLIHGCLKDKAQYLEHLNLGGVGIYVAVNQTDLNGRRKENITALRAVWADLDDKLASEHLDLAVLPLPPTMAVRSGHGVHLYWVFPEAIPCDELKRRKHEAMLRGIQKKLVPLGADSKVCTVQCVLRVPGFFNVKREPVLVEVVR